MKYKNIIIERTKLVKNTAHNLGFMFCGISKSRILEEEAHNLEKWLNNNHNGKMEYMNRYFDIRLDPCKLVPNAKSVISLAYNYFPKKELDFSNSFKIAKYAYGKDYHFVIKDKLKHFLSILKDEIGEITGRGFVDSAPILERKWAENGGLGWIGKNSLILNKNIGSYFFLAELILDVELVEDSPTKDYCGTCTSCIDACPTDAILEPYVIDSNKCISYLTIELKDEISLEFRGKMDDWIFGCDICQEVCPWNRFSKQNNETSFDVLTQIKHMSKKEWIEMTEDTFNLVFKNSPLKRTKYAGIKKNIRFVRISKS